MPFTHAFTKAFDYYLCYTLERLELRQPETQKTKPIFVDFLHGPLGYRLAHGKSKRQPLAKAVGLAGVSNLKVIDATAGTGRDALVLALLGCHVLMIERSPIIAALLSDGLKRAAMSPIMKELVNHQIHLEHTDAITYLNNLAAGNRPDVVYLDPMYPPHKKSAANKKEMRILRDIVGGDADANVLLKTALACATVRVVVKRPRWATPLVGRAPSTIIQGNTTRYDVYLI